MKSGGGLSYRRLHVASFPSILASLENFPTHFSHHPFNDRALVKKVIKQPFFSQLSATLNHSRASFFRGLRVCGRRRVAGPTPSLSINIHPKSISPDQRFAGLFRGVIRKLMISAGQRSSRVHKSLVNADRGE